MVSRFLNMCNESNGRVRVRSTSRVLKSRRVSDRLLHFIGPASPTKSAADEREIMTDRNENQNQPKPGQRKNPNQAQDDQKWDQTSGNKGSTGRDRSKEEPASVADDRGNVSDRNRRDLDGNTDQSQQESGINDPVSDTNRDRSDREQNPDRGNR